MDIQYVALHFDLSSNLFSSIPSHNRPEDYRGLLNCVFGYDWKCDIKVTVAVINLINHLVSTNSTFLGRAFQLYVKSLLPSMTTSTSSGTYKSHITHITFIDAQFRKFHKFI